MRFTPVDACRNLLSFAISAQIRAPSRRRSRRLAHTPEERQRALRDAVDLAAPRLVGEEKSGRRIDDVLERGLVDPGDRGFFLLEIWCLVPACDLRFDLGTGRPAEPRLVTVGADRGI